MNWWKDTYGLRREKGKKVANPMDMAEMGRDLLRRDECMLLFDQLNTELKRVEKGAENKYIAAYCDGLRFGMDHLDERIGYLRDRWNDSGIV